MLFLVMVTALIFCACCGQQPSTCKTNVLKYQSTKIYIFLELKDILLQKNPHFFGFCLKTYLIQTFLKKYLN
jgi:hypothetical protein